MRARAALSAMWAKTGPGQSWHSLPCHLLDVAAVARLLLERHVPAHVRRRLAARVGLTVIDFERWVVFLAALHDFGKATPPFQIKYAPRADALKRLGLVFPRRTADTPHGKMTAAPETVQRLVALGWPAALARQAVRWVGGHHGVFPSDDAAIRAGDDVGEGGWVDARAALFDTLIEVLGSVPTPATDETRSDVGLFVAGLTSVADWIGSMSEHFPFETAATDPARYFDRALRQADAALSQIGWRPLSTGAKRSFSQLFGFDPRPLQQGLAGLVDDAREQFFAIVEAPMGEGKTEAAFWVAHELARRADHRGSYFALPTMATANQMFSRTLRFLEASYEGTHSVQLLHGGAEFDDAFGRLRGVVDDEQRGRALERATNCGTVVAEEWFSKRKRGLLAPFAVGTVDQSLLGVMRTRHGFVRLFGLSGKTVVLDEVHAYDAYTSRLLDRLVSWLRHLGASVVILSATLPEVRRAQLCRAWNGAPVPHQTYPRISAFADDAPRAVALPMGTSRSVVVERIPDDLASALDWLHGKIEQGGCAGLIVNTVARAQDAARLAKERWKDLDVLLLHARFFPEDRARHERRLLELIGKNGTRPHRLLVIGTQVLEQSLDIDFDVLATDHAPVDLVLQRTGRLHRHIRQRPPGLASPTLGLMAPEADSSVPSFGVHRLIYEEAILLRSWVVLQRSRLDLPADIEPLIEQVYGPSAPEASPLIRARMAELDGELAVAIDTSERDAENRLLAAPGGIDDPFANFGLPLDEDNPELAKALQALTRLTDLSVSVAFLTDGALTTRRPDREIAKRVVMRTLSITNRAIVYELLRTPPPPAWEDSPWLRSTRAVVLENGRARIGNKEVRDDRSLGLVISTPSEEDT